MVAAFTTSRSQMKPWMNSLRARTYQIHDEENMNIKILPMAYRRYRHSVRRSSLAERTVPKMKSIEAPIKAENGEFASHRLPVLLSGNNNAILAQSCNLSNVSVVTVYGPPPDFHHYTSLQVRSAPCLQRNGRSVNHP